MSEELRFELNVTVNDRLRLDALEQIIKRALEAGIRQTSYGITVDTVRVVPALRPAGRAAFDKLS